MKVFGEIKKFARSQDGTQILINLPGVEPEKIYDMVEIKNISGCEIRMDDGRLISGSQRKMIYKTLDDIADFLGFKENGRLRKQELELVKKMFKKIHCELCNVPDFSLSDCSMDEASSFITTLIEFCFDYGVQMDDYMVNRTDNIGHGLKYALIAERCCICHRKGQMHHWDAIGMGNNRSTYDDKDNRKIELCNGHHKIAHNLGRNRFSKMYHVYGIKFDEEERKERDLGRWGIG